MVAAADTKKRTGRKRGAGEGSIYQRPNGTWAASLMVGRKPNGTPGRRSLYGKTRAEVVRKLDELRGRKAAGLVTEPTKLTVADYLNEWLRTPSRWRTARARSGGTPRSPAATSSPRWGRTS